MVNVHVVGMSHIDLGFTMTEDEFAELLEILVERMLGILDRDPEVHYAIEQMYHYKKLQENRPDLLARVKDYIQAGRIEVMGAMASSMETNFPNGECLVRNQMLGLKWAKEYLDTVPDSAWLVDTFGINAQIPQIYKQFGFSQMFANRFGGDKCEEVFYAEGIDGTRLLTVGKDLASPNTSGRNLAFKLCRSWNDTEQLFQQADQLTGDSPRLVTNYIENEEVFSLHYRKLTKERVGRDGEKWFLSSYHDFIRDLKAHSTEYPAICADLNPEFTGTFSLRTPLKVENRRVETQLMEAEKWSSLIPSGDPAPSFDDAWWKMAFIHFHDVFSGSHGDVTYHSVLDKFGQIQDFSSQVITNSADHISKPNQETFLCLNGLPWERTEWLSLPEKYSDRKILQDGKELPSVWRNGKRYCYVTLPPVGAATLEAYEQIAPLQPKEMDCSEIANEFLRLHVNRSNGAISLTLADGTEVIRDARDYLIAQEDIGGFQIETPNGTEVFAAAGKVCTSAVRKDAMGEEITVSGDFPAMSWNKGKNRLKWEIEFQVRYGENAVYMRVWLDWLGEGTRIRLNLPTQIHASDAIYEIPFGVVKRTSYRPRGTAKGEWPAHRFVAFEDQEKGLAWINQGVAGVEINGRTLSATLLRAYYPGPMAWVPPTAETSQHGQHVYQFKLIPYQGSWKNAGVVRQAQLFNNPVIYREGRELSQKDISFAHLDRENLVVSAIKNAADGSGDLIVRFYETFGEKTDALLSVSNAKDAWLCNIQEEARDMLPCSNEKISVCCQPFEIQTIRIKR